MLCLRHTLTLNTFKFKTNVMMERFKRKFYNSLKAKSSSNKENTLAGILQSGRFDILPKDSNVWSSFPQRTVDPVNSRRENQQQHFNVHTLISKRHHVGRRKLCTLLQVVYKSLIWRLCYFSRLKGYHSVDFIYKVGSVPVYSSEIIHIGRIVNFDLMTKSSMFWSRLTCHLLHKPPIKWYEA